MRNILKKKKSTIISLKIKEALCKAQFISNNKEYRFTGSALPICPRKIALYKSNFFSNKSNSFSDSVMANGNLNHSIVQKWLANKGFLFGKFKNYKGKVFPNGPQYKEITKEQEDELKKKGIRPPKYDIKSYELTGTVGPILNSDGSPQQYLEWRVYDPKSGFSGLIDGILNLEIFLNIKDLFAVCDFKFVGARVFEEFMKEGVSEDDAYRHQLNGYHFCLDKLKLLRRGGKEIVISDTMYLIVLREDYIRNPSNNGIIVIPIKYDKEKFLKQRKLYMETLEKIEDEDIDYFVSTSSRLCKTEFDCKYCGGKHLCFSANPKKEIRTALTNMWSRK